jgi:hypothetical protein
MTLSKKQLEKFYERFICICGKVCYRTKLGKTRRPRPAGIRKVESTNCGKIECQRKTWRLKAKEKLEQKNKAP